MSRAVTHSELTERVHGLDHTATRWTGRTRSAAPRGLRINLIVRAASVTRLTVRGAVTEAPARPEGKDTLSAYREPGEGLKLSVTGRTVLMGWRLPFTVRTTAAGLPRRMFTASCSVHVIELPAGMVPR